MQGVYAKRHVTLLITCEFQTVSAVLCVLPPIVPDAGGQTSWPIQCAVEVLLLERPSYNLLGLARFDLDGLADNTCALYLALPLILALSHYLTLRLWYTWSISSSMLVIALAGCQPTFDFA